MGQLAAALALTLLALYDAPARSQAAIPGVTTQHNDNLRTGANLNETILTTSNVNGATFGRLFGCPVDGFVFAQPLYLPNVTIAGGIHNVLYVATEHDSVFAFDADTGAPLAMVSLGVPVPSSVINTRNIRVEVGITGTPVIDPSRIRFMSWRRATQTVSSSTGFTRSIRRPFRTNSPRS